MEGNSDVVRLVFFGLFSLSALGLIYIATSIMTDKKLQSHPQPLIAWICIAEACMSYNALIEVLNPVTIICYISSYRLLGWTMFKDFSGDDADVADLEKSLANKQCQSN